MQAAHVGRSRPVSCAELAQPPSPPPPASACTYVKMCDTRPVVVSTVREALVCTPAGSAIRVGATRLRHDSTPVWSVVSAKPTRHIEAALLAGFMFAFWVRRAPVSYLLYHSTMYHTLYHSHLELPYSVPDHRVPYSVYHSTMHHILYHSTMYYCIMHTCAQAWYLRGRNLSLGPLLSLPSAQRGAWGSQCSLTYAHLVCSMQEAWL